VRWGDGSRGEWAVLYIPPGLHQLELTTDAQATEAKLERITAPLPALIYFGGGTKYWLWALRNGQFDPHHELMRAPLPNVFQDGEVCWGPHKPPACTGRAIVKSWELFISTTFSNHAASGKSKNHNEDVREVLREAARAGETATYPTQDLIRFMETGMTMDQVIKAFTQAGEVSLAEI
jgi:hypothetical protein